MNFKDINNNFFSYIYSKSKNKSFFNFLDLVFSYGIDKQFINNKINFNYENIIDSIFNNYNDLVRPIIQYWNSNDYYNINVMFDNKCDDSEYVLLIPINYYDFENCLGSIFKFIIYNKVRSCFIINKFYDNSFFRIKLYSENEFYMLINYLGSNELLDNNKIPVLPFIKTYNNIGYYEIVNYESYIITYLKYLYVFIKESEKKSFTFDNFIFFLRNKYIYEDNRLLKQNILYVINYLTNI